jgi:hypothetical protein
MFHFGMKASATQMINKEILPLVKEVANGSFVFVDDFGRTMCLFIYDSPDHIRVCKTLFF